MLSYIIIGLVLVAVVGYFKSLTQEQKKEQISIIRDSATIGIVAGAKVVKETVKATYASGTSASLYVQTHHDEAIRGSRQSINTFIGENGGTARQAGHTAGANIVKVIGLEELNKDLVELQAKQRAALAALKV